MHRRPLLRREIYTGLERNAVHIALKFPLIDLIVNIQRKKPGSYVKLLVIHSLLINAGFPLVRSFYVHFFVHSEIGKQRLHILCLHPDQIHRAPYKLLLRKICVT